MPIQDILQEIVAWKRLEVTRQKEIVTPRKLYCDVQKNFCDTSQRSMRKALAESPTGIIAEFKRRSPSKGWISTRNDLPETVPTAYAQNGASAISILTDEKFFGGTLSFLSTARRQVSIPLLRKDFIIDEYQIFEAKNAGADAILLIAAVLPPKVCASFIRTAHEIGLETLLELHSESEIDAYGDLDTDMLGVNNRNLGSFVTNVETSFLLAPRLPADKVLVSESGIGSAAVIRDLRQAGFRGFLMGEHFMRAENPGLELKKLLAEI